MKEDSKINKIDILFKKMKKMIDSHCHLDHEPLFSNLNQVLKRSKKIGIKKFNYLYYEKVLKILKK